MKVKYVGDPLAHFEGPASITYFDIPFKKGEWTEVPDDHPQADKFRGNGTFEVQGAKKDEAAGDKSDASNPEYEQVVSDLEALGEKVDRRKGLAALQDQLAKATAPKGE